MAKKEEISKPVLERTYNIPLRRETSKVPFHKKAKKAVRAVREFIEQHMKSTDIKVGKHLNLKIWEHGIKNPPHHVKVNVVKSDDGTVKAELFGAPTEKKTAKVRKAKGAEKKPEVREIKAKEVVEDKTELKETKKEQPEKKKVPKKMAKKE